MPCTFCENDGKREKSETAAKENQIQGPQLDDSVEPLQSGYTQDPCFCVSGIVETDNNSGRKKTDQKESI